MEYEKIKLSEIINVCSDFYKNKIDKDELKEFGDKIIIRPYITIAEKSALTNLILTQKEYSNTKDYAYKVAELVVNKFFYCLLGAYTNIELEENLITNENYDLVSPLFKPFVISYCKEDYLELDRLIRDTIQVSNLENIIEVFGSLDEKSIEKNTDEMKNTIKDLKKNEKMIEDLKYIASFNDPLMDKVIENIKKASLIEVNKDISNNNIIQPEEKKKRGRPKKNK